MEPICGALEPVASVNSDADDRDPALPQQQAQPRKAPYQDGLTIVTRIKPGQTEALIELLNSIGGDIQGNEFIPFNSLQKVHFARFVVLEESRDARGRPTPAIRWAGSRP